MTNRIYSLTEAAEIVDMTPGRLRQMCQAREIKAFKSTAGWHIREKELDKVVRQRKKR